MEAAPKNTVESVFSYSLYFSTGALAREVEKLAIKCWKPVGLSPSLGQILYYLLNYTRVTGPTIIARNLFLSPSTVTRLLEKLEKKQLVHRFIYDRVRMVEATAKAWEMEPQISDCEFDFRKRCDALLGENVEQTCRLLNTTTDALRAGQQTVRMPTEFSGKNSELSNANTNTWNPTPPVES